MLAIVVTACQQDAVVPNKSIAADAAGVVVPTRESRVVAATCPEETSEECVDGAPRIIATGVREPHWGICGCCTHCGVLEHSNRREYC